MYVALFPFCVLGGELPCTWSGDYVEPTAVPKVLAGGNLADAAEVAAARASPAHLAAVWAAASHPIAADGDDGAFDVDKYGYSHYPYTNLPYVWMLDTQPTPIPNPHAKEAESRGRARINL